MRSWLTNHRVWLTQQSSTSLHNCVFHGSTSVLPAPPIFEGWKESRAEWSIIPQQVGAAVGEMIRNERQRSLGQWYRAVSVQALAVIAGDSAAVLPHSSFSPAPPQFQGGLFLCKCPAIQPDSDLLKRPQELCIEKEGQKRCFQHCGKQSLGNSFAFLPCVTRGE
ncbi:uncharacterized protein ACIQIH_013437 [Cyanocitta cristata]